MVTISSSPIPWKDTGAFSSCMLKLVLLLLFSLHLPPLLHLLIKIFFKHISWGSINTNFHFIYRKFLKLIYVSASLNKMLYHLSNKACRSGGTITNFLMSLRNQLTLEVILPIRIVSWINYVNIILILQTLYLPLPNSYLINLEFLICLGFIVYAEQIYYTFAGDRTPLYSATQENLYSLNTFQKIAIQYFVITISNLTGKSLLSFQYRYPWSIML